MCIHTLHIHIAMRLLPCIEYPLFSFARFVVDKISFLHNPLVDIFSVVKIQLLLHLVKEVLSAYNLPTCLVFVGMVGRLPDCLTII